MACTTPCHCCKGACCTAGVCTQATCAACEAGGGTYQGAQTSCDPNPCDLPCTDCYKDCTATHDGNTLSDDCASSGGGDPGYFWSRTDSGTDYDIYLWPSRTVGDPSTNCDGVVLASRVYNSITGETRTYNYPDAVAVYSADGCLETITTGSPVQEDVGSICGATNWAGCDNGSGDCMNVTPDPVGLLEFNCVDVACVDDSTCYGGYCVDDVCGPEAPPP